MIVIGSVLAIVLIAAYIFLGMKISESIINADVKIFFWALYTVTLLTIVNLSMSIYFYTNIANKNGPLGPRGLKGKLGGKGDSGNCNNSGKSCRTKTVQIMVEESIQKAKDENDITPMERSFICRKINQTENKNKITNVWTLETLQQFKQFLEDDNNYQNTNIKDNSIDERIVRQNRGEDTLGWLDTLIEAEAALPTDNVKLSGDADPASECV